MVKQYSVHWDSLALNQLKDAYEYICEDSPKSAAKVRKDILEKAASLREQPLRYNADRLRLDGNAAFRAFEMHRYRVSYFVDEAAAEVIIVRVRHTSQEPLGY